MSDEYFKNKFRVASTRLGHWDYGWPGFYYVTICTQNMVCCLGEIKDNNVYLSEVGKIVFAELLKTPELRPYVKLDDFIIMPNHIHVIFEIQEDKDFDVDGRDTARHVSTERKFGNAQPKSLSSIIGSFKSAASKHCHEKNLDFQWQINYYEHIIKNDEDYARIKEYIANNPINWVKDENNPINFK
jgi:putative transposase